MKIKFILSTIFVILLFSGCENKNDEDMSKMVSKSTHKNQKDDTTKQNNSAELTLKTVDGKPLKVKIDEKSIHFKGHENKVVLVNFFATWCPPCKAEIPHLINLQNKYKDDFSVIAILREQNKPNEEVQSFIDYYDINYIVTNSPENFTLASYFGGVQSIPLMILYDKKGNYYTHYVGAAPEEMLEADIKKALEIK